MAAAPGRFQANRVQHNSRIAASLVPCLTVVAGFGGTVSMGIILVRPVCGRWAGPGLSKSLPLDVSLSVCVKH